MTLPFWLAAALGFLIVARTTRFVNDDVLAEGLRNWGDGLQPAPSTSRVVRVRRWIGDGIRLVLLKIFGPKHLSYLLTCPWCLSIWTGLPVAVAVVVGWSPYGGWSAVWAIVGLWMGYSYAYGLLAQNLDGE